MSLTDGALNACQASQRGCQSVGLQTGTAPAAYIQLWHGDANLLQESLEAVQRTAVVILGIAPEVGIGIQAT
jgi:hypothetical protein